MAAEFTVEIAPTGYATLRAVNDKKALREIGKAIDGLARNPEQQGKALTAPFEGLRSLPALRSRFRILYRVNQHRRTVSVLLVGERKAGKTEDVYALAKRLLTALRGEEE